IFPSYPIQSFRLHNVPTFKHHYIHSLHDALPFSTSTPAYVPMMVMVVIPAWCSSAGTSSKGFSRIEQVIFAPGTTPSARRAQRLDRKSTRLNSSHVKISYAVFCLKKQNNSRHFN